MKRRKVIATKGQQVTNFDNIFALISEVENNNESYTGNKHTYNSAMKAGDRPSFFGCDGWQAGRELMNSFESAANKELLNAGQQVNNSFALVPEVCGQFNDVVAYISGQPDCMANFETAAVYNTQEIFINLAVPHYITPQQLQKIADDVFSMVYNLEMTGTRCKIIAGINCKDRNTGICHQVTVGVKDFHDPLNGSLHSYMLGSGTFMRVFLLSFLSLLSSDQAVGAIVDPVYNKENLFIDYMTKI